MHHPTPEIHARSLIRRFRMKSSEARTTADAVAGRADVEPLHGPRHHLAVQDVIDRDVRVGELRARMADRVPLVLDRDARDVLLFHAVDGHVPIHLHREDPDEIRLEGPIEDRVPDVREDGLRVGLARGHLLFVDDEGDFREPGRHVPPPRDRAEDPRPASREDAGVRLAVAAAPVEQVLALHRDSIEGVRGGAADDGVDVGPRQPRGVERHLRGLEAHLFAGLLEAATEERHARPDDADLPHRPTPRTATAPVALGTNRHDWATPTWTPST